MKKLGKKILIEKDTLEAYCTCYNDCDRTCYSTASHVELDYEHNHWPSAAGYN